MESCSFLGFGIKIQLQVGSKLLSLLSHLTCPRKTILKMGFHLEHRGEPGKALSWGERLACSGRGSM